MPSEKGGIIFLPDIEYRGWKNKNEEILKTALETKQIPTVWMQRGKNKEFLKRYFEECGYQIIID